MGDYFAGGLYDAYPLSVGNLKGAVTWAEPGNTACVDHILLGKSLEVTQRRMVLDSDSDLSEIIKNGLPSSVHPSDHLPLSLILKPTGPPETT